MVYLAIGTFKLGMQVVIVLLLYHHAAVVRANHLPV